jgi:hypothetical protein
MSSKPEIIAVSFCPAHGPFIHNTEYSPEGCPIQVDYDGITCSFLDEDETDYYLDNNL